MNKQSVAQAARAGAAIALALSFTISTPAAGLDALTLPEAQRRAVARSQLLVAQDAAIAASREMAVAAAQLPDPVATLGINNLPINGPDAWSLTGDFMTMRSVGLMQEITRTEKREARAARFDREAEKSLAEKVARTAVVERDTALAWLDRYYAESQLVIVDEQRTQARLEIDAAESAYRGGRGNLNDILVGRGSLVMLDDRASELGRRVRTAKIALARWIGDAADRPLGGKPAIDTVRLAQADLDEQFAHHPQIAVLSKQEELAAADVKVAQANKKPDWSVQLMYSQRGSAYSNMISVGVSVPLQWDRANRQDREVAARLAMLDQARAEREDMVRAHNAEVKALLAEWENGRERSARYARDLVPLALQRTEATTAAYRGAKASIGDLLMARRNEIDVRLQALQLEMETARLWAQLNFLVPDGDVATHATASQWKDSR